MAIDYASPVTNRRASRAWEPRPRFAAMAVGVVQIGLLIVAIGDGWLPTAPGDGGPIHVRIGRWLIDGRVLVSAYGVALALSIAAAVGPIGPWRRNAVRLCVLWWSATLLTLDGGVALPTEWPG